MRASDNVYTKHSLSKMRARTALSELQELRPAVQISYTLLSYYTLAFDDEDAVQEWRCSGTLNICLRRCLKRATSAQTCASEIPSALLDLAEVCDHLLTFIM